MSQSVAVKKCTISNPPCPNDLLEIQWHIFPSQIIMVNAVSNIHISISVSINDTALDAFWLTTLPDECGCDGGTHKKMI